MFPYDDYLQLARDLAIKKDEASQRSAVSRAYYASFHKCKIYAEDTGFQFPRMRDGRKANIHEEVGIFFEKFEDGDLVSVGANLRRLKTIRNKCDYDSVVSRLENKTEDALVKADNIFNSFGSITV